MQSLLSHLVVLNELGYPHTARKLGYWDLDLYTGAQRDLMFSCALEIVDPVRFACYQTLLVLSLV